MPELPEVETVRRVLEPHLLQKTVRAVHIYCGQVIAAPAPEEFAACLAGQKVEAFSRRGKFLRLCFAGGAFLTIHLRMTGCLTLEAAEAPLAGHTHIALSLDDGMQLRYVDVRRLGKLWFTPAGGKDVSGADKLGIEPFGGLTAAYLRAFGGGRRPVKALLLDQRAVAGIGNIYSDEILFSCGIRPDRPCCTLTDAEWEKLAAVIPERLEYFIEKNSISFADYAAGGGKDYRNTPFLQVYGRGGQPCPDCGAPLARIVLGGRSSVFCPHCQK